ncbi:MULTISPECIES: YqkE family protein [Bacillus]|uniref:Sulfurtransferase n=2 Tax=Bacillus TaxID=1386 RepID=A0A0M4FTJ2_9BACI|nr:MULTISPECIES: YqkE family protein [Bacillus]ALC81493.1 hypothetical protein AM592_07690 [Bacillus gobiensis]MBP1080537.1 putative nuclease with TOPRIM domain [Bacillus capparidis]MED1094393.1 YqkE family protein [Bacillus capparidis]
MKKEKKPELKEAMNDELKSKLFEMKNQLKSEEEEKAQKRKEEAIKRKKEAEQNKSFEELLNESDLNWKQYKS